MNILLPLSKNENTTFNEKKVAIKDNKIARVKTTLSGLEINAFSDMLINTEIAVPIISAFAGMSSEAFTLELLKKPSNRLTTN
ncbi:hypothetical protein VCHA50P416_170079 [Vibrio chagasii]|nr:hypothetical protein VCHA28FP16_110136 [Vibrio chagasii]CAH6960837.1 hypothetical protein VCHA42P256_170031 [Vibrio chagasii]CAH7002202.1 hypothetical protein VCHA43P272_190082 [Vibrio chagasii]CAH7201607.1 hypothetical protein VCHA50P416_170079 [Vibrio chagasii]